MRALWSVYVSIVRKPPLVLPAYKLRLVLTAQWGSEENKDLTVLAILARSRWANAAREEEDELSKHQNIIIITVAPSEIG